MGKLYVVATPIGNMNDISQRAVEILREASLIVAEDTRHSGLMLHRLGIKRPLLSYHRFNAKSRHDDILTALAAGDVALISDAGTPAVSDPGAHLVDAVVRAGFEVVPIPGPSAATAAWSIAGMPEGPFITVGFLPRKSKARTETLARVCGSGFASVFYEAPARLATTLADLQEALGDREAVICRELTKLHEETMRGTIFELREQITGARIRGETVIVVGPGLEKPTQDPNAIAAELLARGLGPSQAARELASATGMSRSDAYRFIRETSAEDADQA